MHHIERGSAPTGLSCVSAKYTEGWVQRYRHSLGRKPRDAKWTTFKEDLRRVFHSLCAYCEKRCSGEVDHFLPKSKFPELVYRWSNWIFACHDCNFSKGRRSSNGGYVNPCAKFWFGYPERYFTFDIKTGCIRPKPNLSAGSVRKAWRTIQHLRLNDPHHRENRLDWIRMVSAIAGDDFDQLTPNDHKELAHLSSVVSPWSSVVRVWLSERGYWDGGRRDPNPY